MSANEPRIARHGDLRRALWALALGVAAGTTAILLLLLRPSHERAVSTTPPSSQAPAATWSAGKLHAPDFRLTDQRGRPISLAGLRGRPVIVTFIDPLCRDYCPIEARGLTDVVNAFPANAKPVVVAVSVNVYGNSHANLFTDIRKWKLPPEWRWAVGPSATLARAWHNYHVEVLVSTRKIAGVTVHRIAHTEAAYVVDAHGFQRALFLWPYRSDAVVRTLRLLAAKP